LEIKPKNMTLTMNQLSLNEADATKLLDFNQKFDIGLLDRVVNSLYQGQGEQHEVAKKILQQLKEHPDSWMKVDSILEASSNQETKFYALQILENVIKTRWMMLPKSNVMGSSSLLLV
jgi:exportin-1